MNKTKRSPSQNARNAAIALVATPPGGWPETKQAEQRLLEEIITFAGNQRRYYVPGALITSRTEAIAQWEAWAADSGAKVHPGRK